MLGVLYSLCVQQSLRLGLDLVILVCLLFFKQKTAYEMRISDWSSDVCSSDLDPASPGIRHVRPWPRSHRATVSSRAAMQARYPVRPERSWSPATGN